MCLIDAARVCIHQILTFYHVLYLLLCCPTLCDGSRATNYRWPELK